MIQRAFENRSEEIDLVTASTLKEACDYLSESTPNLIITDYKLPDGDSLELLPQDNSELDYPVVVMTGQGDEQVASKVLKAGAKDYIIKSDDVLSDLPRTAKRVLNDWQLLEEKKSTEKALLESEERYRMLVEHSPDCILLVDTDTRVLYANQATVNLFAAENIDTLLGDLFRNRFEENDALDAKKKLIHMFEKKTGPQTHEYQLKKYNGEKIYTECVATPVTYKGQIAIQTIIRNKTEQRAAKEALQKAHDQLESKVEERTRELSATNEKLLELDQLKSLFIASMSHELRPPLNSIIGFTGVLLNGMSGELNAQQKNHLGRVYRSGKHLLSLVSDVIDISKLEAGKYDSEVVDCSLNELIHEVFDNTYKSAEEKHLVVNILLHETINLHTDRRGLMQVILNFVSNAIKYTHEGQIDIDAGLIHDRVWVKVTDSGIGIDKKDQERLFLPFERLSSSESNSTLGVGLGLYLSQKITTDVLKGCINIESTLGKGSVFSVEIPLNLNIG